MTPDRVKTGAGFGGTYAGRAPRPNVDSGRSPYTGWGRLRDERGQGITEFAMVLPLFALMAIVLVLLGKALYVYIQVTHIANEAARLAAVDQPTSSLSGYLSSEYALPGGTNLSVCYPDGGNRGVGEPVEVAAWTSASWVPFISSTRIQGSATMRIEQDTTLNTNLNPAGTC